MAGQDYIQKSYDLISKDYNVGTIDDFKKSIERPEGMKKVYDYLSESFNVGDFDSFSKNMLPDKTRLQQGGNFVTQIPVPEPAGPLANVPEPVNPLTNHGYAFESIRRTGTMPTPKTVDKEKMIGQTIDENRQLINTELDSVAKDIQSKYEQFRKEHPVLSALSSVRGGIRPGVENEYTSDARYANLSAASRLLDESEQLLKAGNGGGIIAGAKDAASNIDTYSMGLSDLLDNQSVFNALQKYQENKPLTEDEERLLDAVSINAAARLASKEPGLGYTAGSAFVQSVPFMLEMMLNPISGAGRSGGKALAKYAAERFAKAGANKLLKGSAKAAGHVAADAMAATGMAMTTGTAGVAADTYNRMSGVPVVDNQFGEIQLSDVKSGESAGKAFYKSLASRSIENFSEMFGEYFGPIGNVLSNTSFGKKLSSSAIINELNKLTYADWAKKYQDILKDGRFNGFIGETAEEYVGGLLNAALVGDQSFEDLASVENLVQTVSAVGLMSGVFGAVNLAGVRSARYQARKKLEKSEKEAYEAIGEDFNSLKEEMLNNDPDSRNAAMESIISSQDLSVKQKQSLINYLYYQNQYDGLLNGENKRVNETIEAENNAIREESNQETGMYVEASLIVPLTGARIPGTIVKGSMDDANLYVTWRGEDGNVKMVKKSDIDPATIQSMPTQDVIDSNATMMQQAAEKEIDHDMSYDPSIPAPEENLGTSFVLPDGGTYRFISTTPEGGFIAEQLDNEGNVIATTDQITAEDYYNSMQRAIDAVEDANNMSENKAQNETSPSGEESKVSETGTEQVSFPMKGEEIDYSKITEPNVYAAALQQEFGNDAASVLDEIITDKQAELEKASKGKDAITRRRVTNKINTELSLLNEARNIITPVQTKEVIKQVNDNVTEPTPVAKETVPELATAEEVQTEQAPLIPVNEQGVPQYHLTSIDNTLDDLLDGSLSIEEVNSFVDENIKAAEKELKEVEKRKPKMGTSKADYLAQREAIAEELNAARQKVEYWNNVKKDITPEEQDSQVIDKWMNEEPMNLQELAAQMIATGRLKLLQADYKKQTGYGNKEARKMFGIFASKENGGVSLEKAGEIIELRAREEGLLSNEQEIEYNSGFEALMDVLTSSNTRGDINNYISRNREDKLNEEKEYQRNLAEQFAEEVYGMSYDDYLAYEESIDRTIRANMLDEALYNELQGEIYDNMMARERDFYEDIDEALAADRLNNVEQQQIEEDYGENESREYESLHQGSDGILPETQVNQEGRGGNIEETEQAVADIGSENGVTQEESRELDENGYPFVLASDGTTVFGNITSKTGLVEAPIKLSVGFQGDNGKGYGLAHIEANHGEQIRNAGFSSVKDFVSYVARNYDEDNVRVGKRRKNGSQTFLIQITDTHDNTLFIELSKDSSYWNVNSAGIFRKGYSNKKETVVKTEPQQPKNAVSTGSSLSENRKDGIISSEPNGEPTVSENKYTNTSSKNKEKELKINQNENLLDFAQRIVDADTRAKEEQKIEQNPTDAQKEAGNYKKGHIKVDGLDITIEQPKGSVRSGKDRDGKEWSVTMNNTYGYIRGTKGVDGDHIDVFLSDDTSQGNVYVVDQVNPDGSFDEHKVMYGFPDIESAKTAYMSNYEKDWKGLGNITEVSKEDFKKWIDSSVRKSKPFAEYKGFENKSNKSTPAKQENKSVSKNKLVTDERYEELKKRMRAKLGGQMNLGVDPEILAIGTEMAVYHIEKGARKFADYAKNMIDDMGDAIRPYLKSFYNGARDLPEVQQLGWDKDMTSYDEVSKFDIANLGKEEVNPIETAQIVTKEKEVEEQADTAKKKIKKERNKKVKNESKDLPLSINDLFTFKNNDNEQGNTRTDKGLGTEAREETGRPERRGNDRGVHGDNVSDKVGSRSVSGTDSVKQPVVRNTNNFRFPENRGIEIPSGEIAKLKANIEAIKTLKEIEKSGVPATPEQQSKMAKYVGWGGLAEALNESKYNFRNNRYYADKNWNEKYLPYYEQIKNLLTKEEFDSAVKSTTTSHYTPSEVVNAMWNIAERLGFKGGNISEPAMGIGNILGMIPQSVSGNSYLSGFEIDSLSGRIAKALYPDANIKVEGYEKSFAPNTKDLVITNVPFGKNAPYDKVLDKQFRKKLGSSYNLHNYFILKGLLELKEGGLGVFVTTSATMDGADSRFREYISGNNYDLVGAIRLPNNAFLKGAGTSVTTDILIFRKRKPGESSNGIGYTSTVQIGEGTYHENGEDKTKPIMVNEYFANNPDMMLGEMMTAYDAGSGGLYSGASQTLKAKPGADLGKELSNAINKLPEGILSQSVSQNNKSEVREATTLKEGTITAKNGKVYVSFQGELRPIKVTDTFIHNGEIRKVADAVNDYNNLKEVLNRLISEEQTKGANPEPTRKELNKVYDEFVAKYGTLNRNKALDDVIAEDVEHGLPLSLESVKRVPSATGKSMVWQVTKADGILNKRVSYPFEIPTKADNISDAVNISKSYKGNIDIPYIAEITGKTEDDVTREMLETGLAYKDPITGNIIDKNTYLSGNVKDKLLEAKAAVEDNPEFQKNVDDLENVQPERIPYGDISFRLGTTWIPEEFINAFAETTLGISSANPMFVSEVEEYIIDKNARITDYAKSSEFKTSRLSAIDIFKAALNQRKPKVYDEVSYYEGTSKKTRKVVNEQETQAAAEKIAEMSDKFVEYMDSKTMFHQRIEDVYNDKYNNYVLKKYEKPAFDNYPNANKDIKLRDHQTKAVQRCLSESTLLAHQVGTGKTFTMITTAMEMRRLGIANKPMIVVQNATLEDFVRDFYKLYPSAKILSPSKEERNAENRKRLFNLIATGDFDAIVVPQSFMAFIPDSEERKKTYIQKRIDDFEAAIERIEDRTIQERLRKEVNNLRDSLEGVKKGKNAKGKAKTAESITAKTERILDRRTDDVLTFEQMGVDALFVDEAHNYKKIGFPSKMSNVKGIDTSASQRANSMLLKAQWVAEKNGGRNVILATGTPITNTMAEVWTMMNFVSPDILDAYSIKSFDEFATTFGTVEPSLEFTATGNFKIAERFKSYTNVPELVKAFRSHTDVVLTEDVKEFKQSNNIPKLKDNKMTNIVVEKNEDLEDVMQTLIHELEEFNKLTGKAKRDKSALPLVVFTKAKQAAIDLRLLNPTFPDNPDSKTNRVVENVLELYKESTPDKGTQLIFCDSYQSPSEKPKMDLFDVDLSVPQFNLYNDIKRKLVEGGIPANEIAIVSNYEGEKRNALFDKVRNGDVRVLIGSTEKMGVGVNVQDRLFALHHIDAPIRPMDFEQRNGRILRQGNLYATWGKPVNVVTYGVKGTLDATAYDRLRIKQNFINQMMKGDTSSRIMEEQDDEDPSGMTFSEMAATLSGDKTAQLLFVAQNKLKKLQNSKRSDLNSKSSMQVNISVAKSRLNDFIRRKEEQKEITDSVKANFPDGVESVTVKGKTISKSISTELSPIVEQYYDDYTLNRNTPPLKISLNNGKGEAIVHFNEGKMVYNLYVDGKKLVENRDFSGAKGLMASIDRQIESQENNLSSLERKIEDEENKISGLEEAIKKPWGKEEELKAAQQEVENLQKQLEEKAKQNDVARQIENESKLDVNGNIIDETIRYREGITPSKNNNDPYYRFIGETGAANLDRAEEATTRLDNLSVARKMEGEGKDAKAIKYATGWERGADNKWRYETSDLKLKGGWEEKADNLLGVSLDKVVEDKELFAAYPELKDITVSREEIDGSYAYYTPIEKTITISNKIVIGNEGVLSHEIQHIIQDIEGFAQGGSVTSSLNKILEVADVLGIKDKKPTLNQIRSYIESGYVPTDKYKKVEELAKKNGFDNPIDYVNSLSPTLYYTHLAGEVEARNVQSRLNMTLEQRRNSLASETEDVAREDQVFIENALSRSDARLMKNVSESNKARVESKRKQAVIDELSNSLNTSITVYNSLEEIVDENPRRQRNKRAAKGWYDYKTGEVFVVMPNNNNAADIQATILHEVVAHKGLRKMFGEDFDTFLDNVYANATEDIRRKIVDMTEGNPLRLREATEEYLAELAEKGFDNKAERTLWEKVKDAFLDLLRKAGIKLDFQLTDNELRYILWRSYNNLKEGNILDLAEDITMRKELLPTTRRAKVSVPKIADDGTIAEYEATLAKKSYKAREAYQDSMLALKVLQDILAKYSGKPIKSWENAYMAENQLSSKNTAETEAYSKDYFNPIVESVAKIVNTGYSYRDVLNYMIAKHGLERNEVFARRDADQWLKTGEEDLREKLERGEITEKQFDALYESLQRRAEEKYQENRERDYSGLSSLMEDYGEDTDTDYNAFAESLVESMESNVDTTELWKSINNATKKTLQKAYESGMMSKQAYDKVKNMFKYYIPLRGWNENTASDVYDYMNSERSPINSVPRKAGGRNSLADDPLATIGNMAESAILQGNRNLMKQNFLNMVINHPSSVAKVKDMWYVYNEVDEVWEPSLPQYNPDFTADEIADAQEKHEQRMKELKQEGKATKNISSLNVPYRVMPWEAKEHVVTVLRNGKEQVVFINGNPRAAQALNGMTNPDAESNIILNGVSRFNRQLAANFTTRNPAFVFSNLSRDLIFATSAVTVKEDKEYAQKFAKNILTSMLTVARVLKGKADMSKKSDAYFMEFLANGGETCYTALNSVDDYKKKIEKSLSELSNSYVYTVGFKREKDSDGKNKWKPVQLTSKRDYFKAVRFLADQFSTMNRWAEDISRFNTYMTSREMGRGIVESVNDAKEVTVNFNKKGAGYKTMSKNSDWYAPENILGASAGAFRNLYLFFNAAVQSLVNFGRLAERNKKGFGALIGGFTVAGFAMPLINQLLYTLLGGDDDKDYYGDLPDWVRRNNLCIYAGGNRFITIPLPIELRAFYGLGDIAYQNTIGYDGKKGTEIAYEAINQMTELLPLNPLGNNGDIVSTVMPDAFKPFFQIYENKDFTGKPIYKESPFNKTYPEWTKTYRGTSGWLVDLAEWTNELGGGDKYKTSDIEMLNWNPAKAEHLFESYFGGMGKTLNQAGKTFWYATESLLSGEMNDNLVVRNVPVFNRFFNTVDDKSAFSKINNLYFRYLDEYEKTEDVLRGYSKEVSSGNLDYLEKLVSLQKSKKYQNLYIVNQSKKNVMRLMDIKKKVPETDKETLEKIDAQIMNIKADMVNRVRPK